MFGILPLTPAYGRDYKKKADVLKDWNDNKDFKTSAGQYINREQFATMDELPKSNITIRYNKLTEVLVTSID